MIQQFHLSTGAAGREGAPATERAGFAEILSALSFALDLVEGQPPGHAVRSCAIGMHIGREVGLPLDAQSDLYYALLMKDAGCSTNASKMMQILGADDIAGKRDAMAMDWTRLGWDAIQYALRHVRRGAPFLRRVQGLFTIALNRNRNAKILNQMRCERGAAIARRIGLREAAANAILCLNEHWNGLGQPAGLRGLEIPLLSRVMNVAQTVDVFYSIRGKADIAGAMEVVRRRSGRWFDPDVARAFFSVARSGSIWSDVEHATSRVKEMEPREDSLVLDDATLDNICLAFADVIDAKSPFTYRHSAGVAGAAVAIAKSLDLNGSEVTAIRRAALLHDIGKLGVPNTILDKPDKLTAEEWTVVRKHPRYSYEILRRVPGFADLSEIAASHHEKLDGSGYFRNMAGELLSLPARILVVADIYDALAAKRPYRDALPPEAVLAIISKEVPKALDSECFEALRQSSDAARDISASLIGLSEHLDSALRAKAPDRIPATPALATH